MLRFNGAALRAARLEREWSQQTLAIDLWRRGVIASPSGNIISAWEQEKSAPRAGTLAEVAATLQVRIEALFADDEQGG